MVSILNDRKTKAKIIGPMGTNLYVKVKKGKEHFKATTLKRKNEHTSTIHHHVDDEEEGYERP